MVSYMEFKIRTILIWKINIRHKILDSFLVMTYSFSKKCHILKFLPNIFGFLYLLVS